MSSLPRTTPSALLAAGLEALERLRARFPGDSLLSQAALSDADDLEAVLRDFEAEADRLWRG